MGPSSLLILSGSLILGVGQSYEFPSKGQTLWFSKEGILSIQSMPGKNLLRPLEEGLLFSSGLEIPKHLKTLTPLPIHVYSAKDLQHLKSCPLESLDFSSYPPLLFLDPDRFEDFGKRCRFSKFQPAPSNLARWEQRFLEIETGLIKKGFKISRQDASSLGLQRQLKVPAEQLELLKEELGSLLPMYELKSEVSYSKPGRTLLIELSLLEISRSKLESIGLKIPTQVELNPKSAWSVDFPEKLLASLSQSKGAGRLLAQPKMRVKPGEKAKFSSGGEIAFKQAQRHGETIVWKSYGLNLNLEPDANVITGASEISILLNLDFSEPDLSAPHGNPGMIHRKLESRFDLRTGEASILGTLNLQRLGSSDQGPAALSWFPSLEKLLSHHQNSQTDSELWLVVRPSWEDIPIAQFRQRENSSLNAKSSSTWK